MTVYYITLAAVVFYCLLADKLDKPSTGKGLLGPVRHMGGAWFFFMHAALPLVLVAGLRYRVGTDFGAYYFGYQRYIDELAHAFRTLDEPGYGFIAWVATRFSNTGTAAVLSASIVTVGLALVVIYRNSEELLLPTVLLVLMGFWHGSFNGVRQYLAAAVLFCGYRALRERNLLGYLLTVFLAFLFHRSAVVMALMYFAVYREVNLRNSAILVAVCAVALYSYDQIFDMADVVMDKDYSMEESYTSTMVNRLRVLSACVPVALFLMNSWEKQLSHSQTFSLNIAIIHAAIRVVTMNSALLYRIGIYTTPFMVLAIPELLKGLPDKQRQVYGALLVIMYGIMWWYELSHSGSLNHFQWVWEQ